MADASISALTEVVTPEATDPIPVVNALTTKKVQLANLPISTATQAALDEKLDLAGGTMTGDLTTTGLNIVNSTTANTISVDQNADVGASVATDGAVHIENTGNPGIGLGVYTNAAAEATAVLAHLFVDNPAFTQGAVKFENDGTGRALWIDSNNSSLVTHAVLIQDESTAGGNASLRLESKRTGGATVAAYTISMSGSATGVYVAHTGNGRGMYLVCSTTTTRGIDVQADSLTSGIVARFASDSASTTARNLVEIVNDNVAATAATPLKIQQDAVVSTNFKKIMDLDGVSVYKSDGTTPNGTLSGTAGDVCYNGPSGQPFYCSGTTSWVGM